MFKIIIMCGGYYENFKEHKALSIINGERLPLTYILHRW